MKKILLIFILLIVANKGFSQSYIPFPDSAAVWVNAMYTNPPLSIPGILAKVDNYCMSGQDTLINSTNYTKLNYCGGAYKGGVRDNNNGKVYIVPKDSLKEYLLYDFTLNIGDTVSHYCSFNSFTGSLYYSSNVWQVDTVVANGKNRRRIRFAGSDWIEGVGSTWGLFSITWPNVSGTYSELHCMSYNDTVLYTNNSVVAIGNNDTCALDYSIHVSTSDMDKEVNAIQVFPNPTSEKISILLNQDYSGNVISVFDCFGREIINQKQIQNNTDLDFTPYANGVYLISLKDSFGNLITTKKIIKIN